MPEPEETQPGEQPPEQPILAEVTIYSAPRRFDLATLLTVTTAYALMFALMRSLGADDVMLLWVGLFVTMIGLAQASLFGGTSPRAASMLAGGAMVLATVSMSDPSGWIFAIVPTLVVGVPLGYLTGALIGGIFLIAHAIRRRIER